MFWVRCFSSRFLSFEDKKVQGSTSLSASAGSDSTEDRDKGASLEQLTADTIMTRIEWLLCYLSIFKSVLSVSGPETQGPVFITEPRPTLEFLNDMGAVLSCSAHGSPEPSTSWVLSDGSSVTPVMHIREITKNGSLYFPPFGAENYRHDVHSTSYQCEATNSVGKIFSREVNVRAVVKQHYDIMVRDTYVLSGNTAVLRCEIPTFVKDHISITSWVQDSSFNIYPSPYSEGKHHMLPSGELLVYAVTAADSHPTYRCRTVHHITGKTVESSTYGRVIVTESRGPVPPRYHERVSPLPVREGEIAVLSCTSQGYPPPQYFWFRALSMGGHLEPLTITEKKHIREGILVIQNSGLGDSGRYVCIANNTAGSERVELQLTILVPITVHLTPQRVTVDLGHDTALTCSVTGHPTPAITWRKDGLPVRNMSHRLRIKGENNSRLEITRVAREDKGMYQCFAKNDYEMSQGTAELRLGDSTPQLMYKFIEQTMQPGPSVSLKCIAAGNPTPHFTWTLDGFPLPHNDRLVIGQYVTVHGDVISHVNISSVNVEDGGEYRCTAKNRVGSMYHSARLNIYGLPLVRPMNTLAAVAGHDLVLQCPVAGYPIASIIWEKDGQLLPINRRQEVSSNGTLVIHKVDSMSDGGSYMCLARNKQGHHDSKSVQIEVKVPPKIEHFSFPSDIQQGSRVLVTCVISSGDLPLRIEWLFNGSPNLPEGITTYTHGEDDLSLRIANAAPTHTGNYTCVARNQAAQVSHEAALIVHVPPRIAPFSFNKDLSEGVRAHVSCVIEKGDPPFTITWLKDREPLSSDGLKIVGFDTHSSTVIVDQLAASHSGNYTCRAANQVAAVEHTAELVVSVPPRWLLPPENHQAPQGAFKYSLDCQAEGNPTPTVTWRRGVGKRPGTYRDLSTQEHNSDPRVYPNGSLVIEVLKEEHEGYYLCEAFNGIGTGLSKRIYLTVNAPPQFVSKHKNHTSKLGSSAVLKCEVNGDRPIKILWRKAGSAMDGSTSDYRFSIKESNSTEGAISEMIIFNTMREDSGQYYCIASNAFGRDEMVLQLFVQEPPDFPRNIHVIEKGSRFVKLGWVLSQDGNSPILQCIAEYKMESEKWHEQSTQIAIPANQATALISSLRPAITYQFRLFAENELGKSQPSEVLDVMTESEVPSGAPRNLQANAVSATELHVIWDAPERELWNGEILGYHVGYKEQRLKDDQYQYKNVESRSGSGGKTSLTDLKKFTKYSIIAQAYNALGPGPTSSEVLVLTLEDVPSAAPQDIRCTAFTSQSLQISWSSVPDTQLHGHLKGYKVIWENLEDFDISSKPEAKITTALSVVIHGLEKFTNYSVQVLAFTNAGDGVPSSPLHCITNEDVPEVPSAIKAVVSNPTSIVVSWLPPTRANGILTSYNLQIRSVGGPSEKDSKPKRHSVPPHHTSYEEEGLNKRGQYEFTVAAATKVGEGARTLPVTLSPTSEVRAAIYSFGSTIILPWKSDARLPCKSVGKPEPSLSWKQWSQPIKSTSRFKVLSDGTLQIANLVRDDSGNYSCYVENQYGSDTIIHRLMVQVPPSSPLLHATSATSTSLNVQWKQGDDGGAPIRGYYLFYKKNNGDWESVEVGRQQNSYLLKDLNCGTPYQIYIQAFNSIGKGEKSQVVLATTDGSRPGSISKEAFLIPNTTFVTLFLENWLDNSCPITYFELDYRRIDESKWTLVSSSLVKQKYYLLKSLHPGTEYVVRIKAHNNAGSADAEYRFFTLHKPGNVVSPSLTRHSGQTEIPFYLDLRLVLPLFISCLAVLSAVLAVYYCLNKRPILADSVNLRESNSSNVALDNKQNMQQREQYYATVKKPLRSPVRDLPTLERIPEYSEDIYPYATFQLNQTSAGGETRCTSGAPLDIKGSDLEDLDRDRDRKTPISTFLYHDPLLTTAETLKLREDCGKSNSKSNYRGVRRKTKSFKSDREDFEYDSLGSETDAEVSGTDQGVSSRTESSNQLDSSLSQGPCLSVSSGQNKDRLQSSRHRSRLHNFIYQGPDPSNSGDSSQPYDRTSFPRRGRSKMLQLARYSFEAGRDGSEQITSRPSSIPFGSASPYVFKLDPPSGFSDSIELSEAECDRSVKLSAYRSPRQSNTSRDFTIAV